MTTHLAAAHNQQADAALGLQRSAFAWMQARLVELLLRYDERTVRRYIDERSDAAPDEDDALRRYRDLAVVFALRDGLFEHILPRIVRRLSFQSPHHTTVEEPPPRGRVDWERTLSAAWDERPGEPPLLLHTRQRRRDFATPENLLTVATLLEYRSAVLRLLWDEGDVIGAAALRHPLHAIVEQCDRELAFPQFTGLRHQAERVWAGEDGGVETLAAQVAARLIPGGNSAYEDLLRWRARLRSLRLLQRLPDASPAEVLGADPQRDNYLYQLWIFYELADLLAAQRCLEHIVADAGRMALRFRWGAGGVAGAYELQYDQAIAGHWTNAPGVRPDLYVARVERQEVRHAGRLIWREPGYVLAAKYYQPRPSAHAPGDAVKRMIADLHLSGERHAALLFAFQQDPGAPPQPDAAEPDLEVAASSPGAQPLYRVAPAEVAAQTTRPDVSIAVWRICPDAQDHSRLRAALAALLDEVHRALRHPVSVQCHGVFLDALSTGERQALVARDGQALAGNAGEWLVCPKPHIGPWRVDLVSRAHHCCQDGTVCHIAGRPDARKPLRPPRSADDLLNELQHLFAGSEAESLDPETVSTIARRVEELTRRFAEVAGAYRQIEVYYHRLRDLGMMRTLDLLGPAERESLALAIFLVEQLDTIGASDYSAPTIHVSSVMEIEVKRRIFGCPGLVGQAGDAKRQTLGTLPYMRRRPEETEGDWHRILAYVDAHWNGHIDPDDPETTITFDDFVKTLDTIAQLRNKAAHTSRLSRDEYRRLFGTVCQSGKLRIGALNVLLLAWQ